MGAGRQCFGNVAGIFDPAVGDDRHVTTRRRFGAATDGGDLRHADPGNDSRRADRAWSHADFDDVHTGFDQRRRAFRCGDVTAGEIEIRIAPTNASDHVENPVYRTLTADDLFDLGARTGIHFDQSRQTGVVFHMMSALGEHGRTGLTAVAESREEAHALYEEAVTTLDEEAAAALAERRLP